MKNPEESSKCYGKISVINGFKYEIKSEYGTLYLEVDNINCSNWLNIKCSSKMRRYLIKDLQFDKVSPRFEKECADGKFKLEFNKQIKIEFENGSQDRANCTTFATILLSFKSQNSYGNTVHDLSFPNLNSSTPIKSPFAIQKTEIKTSYSANVISTNEALYKNNNMIRSAQTLTEKPSKYLSWHNNGTNGCKRSRERDTSPKYNEDSDEENNIQVNKGDRFIHKKVFYKNDDNLHRRKSFPCHAQNTTPNSKLPKTNYGQRYTKDSYSRSPIPFPVKRTGLLSGVSVPKKSKPDFEIDNKENEGERQNLPIGFPNLGNTCYVNAGLTAIYAAMNSCISCEAAFMSVARKMIVKDNLYQKFCRLLGLAKNSQSKNLGDSIEETLKSLKTDFEMQHQLFAGHEMQDTQEYLMNLFSSLENDLTNENSKKLINYFFHHTTRETKKCTGCSDVTSSSEVSLDCPINVLNNVNERNIQSSLAYAFKNSSHAKHCDKCDKSVMCTTRTKIIELPRIFIIYAKRYDWTGNACKNNATLEVPKYITIDPYCVQNAALSSLPEEFKNIDETCSNGPDDGLNGHDDGLNVYEDGLNGHDDGSNVYDRLNGHDEGLNGYDGGLNGHDGGLIGTSFTSELITGSDGINDIAPLGVNQESEEEALERAKRLSIEEMEKANGNKKENEEEDIKISRELRDNFTTGTLPHSYRLISCVQHSGWTDGGHYVSYSYDVKRNKFFSFNDSKVSEISEETFHSNVAGGYIFMYLNKDVCLDRNSISRVFSDK